MRIPNEIDHEAHQIVEINAEIIEQPLHIDHGILTLGFEIPDVAHGALWIKIHLTAGKDQVACAHGMVMGKFDGPIPVVVGKAVLSGQGVVSDPERQRWA
ncbi:hypothetical protein NBRC116597_40950 [Phaeobacter sp. NW0010-22]